MNAEVARIRQEANEQRVDVAELPAKCRVMLPADQASVAKVPCGDTHRRNFGCRLTVGKHDYGRMLVVKNQDGEPICAPCACCIRGVIRNPPQYYALLPEEERKRIASALVKSLEGVPREAKAVLDQLYKNAWQLHKDRPVLLPVQIALLRQTRTGGALFSAQFRQMLDALRGPADLDLDDDDDEE
ncbi:uncharacterized protein EHS24_003837 [Apiotrichum porosum]|uniref:Uncharacterized protein n=1 Tax=Apiotrichum porosum TaxID=105984 RepID=A0A427XDK0_9TREE|nr:uncharacterized protein EHS24_003837 [Apiotrichum porosum]RSH76902.1 hypothetical protein EHS24_003837 [Apiotrichum porosum]